MCAYQVHVMFWFLYVGKVSIRCFLVMFLFSPVVSLIFFFFFQKTCDKVNTFLLKTILDFKGRVV